MDETKRDDNSKRQKLLELLVKTETKFTRGDGNVPLAVTIIKEALKTEGIVGNLEHELNRRQHFLKKGECCIVVAGETSAGKSLFLNLLLGEDILPSSHQPCTSVVTRLSYGKKHCARIVYHDESRDDDIFEDFKKEDIRHLVYEQNLDKRESTSDIKEVQICLPSKILENGIVFVDTPGIGENDDMDMVIENFVDENQVMGFIYIIKSDNGGGVDEDRLIKLMRIILQKEKTKSENGTVRFHPGCAMFICNQWDRVTEQDTVQKHIIKRLGNIWPKLNEQKVVPFSTFCAKREVGVDVDYVRPDYQTVLSVLQNVYSEALNESIKATYKWIKSVLQRSVHHLKTVVRQLNCSDNRLENDVKEASSKLNKLKNESTKIVTDLQELINRTSEDLSIKFREYLKSPIVRMAITQFIESELPDPYTYDKTDQRHKKHWMSLKTEIDRIIIDRIAHELDKWEEENGTISALEYEVEYKIQKDLLGLTDGIKSIERNLNSSSTSTDSRRSSIVSITSSTSTSQRRGSVSMKYFEKKDSLKLNIVARNKIFQPFQKIFVTIKAGTDKWNVYAKDRVSYAKTRSEKLLRSFIKPVKGEEDQMKVVMTCFMEEAKDILDQNVFRIPNLITANQNLLCHVAKCKRESLTSRRGYEELMKELEVLKLILADYGAGYIFVDDFKPNELQILDPSDATGGSSIPFKISEFLTSMSNSQTSQVTQFPRGIWTAQQKGLLKNKNHDEQVSVKIYLPCCRLEKCYHEIAKLRLLDHKHIATFIGIQNSGSYLPAMVYRGHLHPLRHHIVKYEHVNTLKTLQEVVGGLEYLHRNGMVHMELNSNTVMTDNDGNIRLTGGCLPRTADFPENPEQHVCGDFVYLSPEVLSGDLYISSADVYAFGLLMFELLLGNQAFENQRRMSLDLFVQNLNPAIMMRLDESLADLSEETKVIIKDCLECSEGSRPTVSTLLQQLQHLKAVPAINESSRLSMPVHSRQRDFDEDFFTRL